MTSASPQPGQQPELPPTVTIGSMLALGVLELLRSMNQSALATMVSNALQNEINQSVATHQAIQQQLSDQAAAAAAAASAPLPPAPEPATPVAVNPAIEPAPIAPIQPVVNAPPAVAAAMAELGGETPAIQDVSPTAEPVTTAPVVESTQVTADVAELPLPTA